MNLLKLFLEFLKIGGFAFGGGMGTLPYIYEMADRTGWISNEYIGKILAITQITPGPLACNIGTITGFKVYGVLGSFIANLGFIIPAIIFMTVYYKILNKIKNNKKVEKIIKIVRSAALAVMIGSSKTIFKTAFWENKINYRNLILAIIIFLFVLWNEKTNCKLKKINSLLLIFISAGLAVIIRVE